MDEHENSNGVRTSNCTFLLRYKEHHLILDNVLVDTGCATTIFDTYVLAKVGINGKPKRMYGISGYSEPCYEQEITISADIIRNVFSIESSSFYRMALLIYRLFSGKFPKNQQIKQLHRLQKQVYYLLFYVSSFLQYLL